MNFRNNIILLAQILLFSPACHANQNNSHLPDGFVYIEQITPGIKTDLRYYAGHNFVGKRITGYLEPKCILTKEAAIALDSAQKNLEQFGLGLKIFDAYRPQRAVNNFIEWASDLEDIKMKSEFYPDVKKENLFIEGYIADKSSHSRGSTVDITIIDLKSNTELDMGSGYDFFGPESWPDFADISELQRSNRMLLQLIMMKHGFNPYPKEWWHFTLQNEPFPDTYFDFPIQ